MEVISTLRWRLSVHCDGGYQYTAMEVISTLRWSYEMLDVWRLEYHDSQTFDDTRRLEAKLVEFTCPRSIYKLPVYTNALTRQSPKQCNKKHDIVSVVFERKEDDCGK
jgi:hypothetical protein